jgi:hypothetical protein
MREERGGTPRNLLELDPSPAGCETTRAKTPGASAETPRTKEMALPRCIVSLTTALDVIGRSDEGEGVRDQNDDANIGNLGQKALAGASTASVAQRSRRH